MRITHYGHSAVLIEVARRRLLLDPGNLSAGWHEAGDLDAVFVTHQHADHLDADHLPKLLAANPGAQLWVEPQVLDTHDLPGARGLAADASVDLGGVTVRAVGGLHAVVHRDIPRVGNVGLVIQAAGEPTVFQPGDALDAVPDGIDVLCIPAYGPWAALKESVDFARAVNATHGFLVHDGLLNDRGRALVTNVVSNLCPTDLVDLRDGRPWEL